MNSSVVPKPPTMHLVGGYDQDTRIESAQKLGKFYIEKNLAPTDSLLPQYSRGRYTWTSPGRQYKNQIHYILIQTRWRLNVNKRSILGLQCDNHHILLLPKVDHQNKIIRMRH